MQLPDDLRENVPLAPLTTFKIGGSARYFVYGKGREQIKEALDFAAANGLPALILGGGSNVLVSDAGFSGVVVQVAIRGIVQRPLDTGRVRVSAEAGENWDDLVRYCVDNDLAGVECLSGIPGLVGGTPVQNVGAYGQEVAETIVSVDCLDRQTGSFVTLSNTECEFTYRRSIFNSTERGRYVVTGATFDLIPGGKPKLAYRDLIEHFNGMPASLAEVREAVLAIRRSKSMVIDPLDPNSRSAGSFFKNPIVDKEKLEDLRMAFEQIPSFEYGSKFKVPAAWLIENAGFTKGFALGEAGISASHTLALINLGNATAAEIVALKELIQRGVKEKFGVMLEPEPVFVGF